MKQSFKVNRTFTLDVELVQLLRQEPNQSSVVEAALREYFRERSFESLPKDVQQHEIRKLDIMAKAQTEVEKLDAKFKLDK